MGGAIVSAFALDHPEKVASLTLLASAGFGEEINSEYIERFIGARALWKSGSVSEMFVTSAAPDAVGLSSIAGMLDPVSRDDEHGLYLKLCPPEEGKWTVSVPLAPGLIVPVGVEAMRRIKPGEEFEIRSGIGSVALDGEREIERNEGDAVSVALDVSGAMRLAAREGLLATH